MSLAPADAHETTGRSRRQAHGRAAILAAAARAFAARGLHGTTVDDIARETGFAPSSLYRYFPSKHDLHRALLDRTADEMLAPFSDPLLPTLKFRERLEWLLRRQLDAIEQNRESFVVFASQRAAVEHGESAGSSGPKPAYERWVAALEDVLEVGVNDGSLRALNPRDMAYFVAGALNTTVFRWMRGKLPLPLQAYVPTLLGMILRGVQVER
ncbi:MAG: TetR/AcrR family transcriptional regulator [Deltaproteobacteria bacterium]|nr:TetR/AcrR family transcriptional regulator [Deltaproteobacteria bacterium]